MAQPSRSPFHCGGRSATEQTVTRLTTRLRRRYTASMVLDHADRSEVHAFELGPGDRFHKILVSDEIQFEREPGTVSALVFFVILRAHGLYDIIHLHKIFEGEKLRSRSVQEKDGVSSAQIDSEVAAVRDVFSAGIRAKTGYAIRWNELDLAGVTGMKEQVSLIRAWGLIKVISDEWNG